MEFQLNKINPIKAIDLYRGMLKPRTIENKMLTLLRQGKISKWFSGIGQEAIAAGVMQNLEADEYVLPMHRNLGVFTARDIPLYRLFEQWQGKANGFTKGRDRSFHFGTQKYKIVGMISHLGPQMGVADGIALAHKLRGEKKLTAVFTGEGGTSEGDFHEALNVASVWQLPVLFCVENNGYGLSTPTNEQYNCEHIADRGAGYGMESHIIDGNNVVEVYTKMQEITTSVRENPRPVLIEFKTFRRRGHEEASGTKYVPQDLMDYWEKRDPIEHYEKALLDAGLLTEIDKEKFSSEFDDEIKEHLKKANAAPAIKSTIEQELKDVYQTCDLQALPAASETNHIRFVDAVSEALKMAMQKNDNLVIMGQDVADYGGVFKITEGFVEAFGKERVRNTPICESAIVSTAMGLSINKMKAVVEMQFGDFVTSGFNPIVNYLAKIHYRWNQNADVVVRMPCGGGVGAGPFHSQTNEAWFTKTPGLKVVYPAFPEDAKGLLIASIEDPNPVMFFEHKALYRSKRGDVPTNYYTTELGKANLLQEGEKVSVITFGAGVHWALEVLENHPDISADLIDLRSLSPLDSEAILTSVRKTGKALILQEDTSFGGVASDVSALISKHCFESLDGPVETVTSLPTPVPFAAQLEDQFLAKSRFEKALVDLVNY